MNTLFSFYVVYQAKLLLDGYEDCLNPYNMDKSSAMLRIVIATAIHIGIWSYMFTTTYAHLLT
ncbi:hypothetical protein AB6D11_00025 [Vibrio splendidus]